MLPVHTGDEPINDERVQQLFRAMLNTVWKETSGSEDDHLMRSAETIKAAIELIAFAIAGSIEGGPENENFLEILDTVARTFGDDINERVLNRWLQKSILEPPM